MNAEPSAYEGTLDIHAPILGRAQTSIVLDHITRGFDQWRHEASHG
jgi:hypothetical protein